MARRQSIGDFSQLWRRHETLYKNIFTKALDLLEVNDEQSRNEDAISEALYLVLRCVCFSHRDRPATPQWERPIPPESADALTGGKRQKRPDFTCSLVNTFANTPEMHELFLHIECKRLGEKAGTWDLNRNYIENGISRFDCPMHEYGKKVPSGIMIGYIVSSKRNDILGAVNSYQSATLPKLSFKFSIKTESCEVALHRKIVEPNKFKLIHIWVDLRGNRYGQL